MSTDVKAFGKLVFESASEMEEVMYQVDDEDAASREVKALIDEGVQSNRKVMHFTIDGALTSDANLWFQEWLGDVVDAARSGSLDTWQEDYGRDKFVRLHANGEEEEIGKPFPDRR